MDIRLLAAGCVLSLVVAATAYALINVLELEPLHAITTVPLPLAAIEG